MFRRTYYVQRAERRNGDGEQAMRDTSFTSFVCILFIFVLFTCLIVMAANWRYLFLVEDKIEYFDGSNVYEKILIDPSGTKSHRPAWPEEEQTTSFARAESTTFDSTTTDADVTETAETVPSTTATTDYATVDAEASQAFERVWNDASETATSSAWWYFANRYYQDADSTEATQTPQSADATETTSTYDDYADSSSRTTDWKRDAIVSTSDLIDLDVAETSSAWWYFVTRYYQDADSTETAQSTTESAEVTETTVTTDDITSTKDKTTTETTDGWEGASESTVLIDSTSDSDYDDDSSSQTTWSETRTASLLYNLGDNTAETTTETDYDYNSQSSVTDARETATNEDSVDGFRAPPKNAIVRKIESSEVDLQFVAEETESTTDADETKNATVRPLVSEQVYSELSKFKRPGQTTESDMNDRSESTYRMEWTDSSEVTDQYVLGEIN